MEQVLLRIHSPSSFESSLWNQCKKAVLDTLGVLDIDPLAIIPFEENPTFNPFVARCIEAAHQRNYISNTFQDKHVIIGAAAAHHAYLFHEGTESHNVPVLSSLLMAFIYFIDDNGFQQQSIAEYGSRLASGRPQLEKGLDDIVATTAELADMYPPITGDFLRLTIQSYVTSNQLERELKGCGKQSKVSQLSPIWLIPTRQTWRLIFFSGRWTKMPRSFLPSWKLSHPAQHWPYYSHSPATYLPQVTFRPSLMESGFMILHRTHSCPLKMSIIIDPFLCFLEILCRTTKRQSTANSPE